MTIWAGREPHRNTGSWGKNCKNKYLGKKGTVKEVRIKVAGQMYQTNKKLSNLFLSQATSN